MTVSIRESQECLKEYLISCQKSTDEPGHHIILETTEVTKATGVISERPEAMEKWKLLSRL